MRSVPVMLFFSPRKKADNRRIGTSRIGLHVCSLLSTRAGILSGGNRSFRVFSFTCVACQFKTYKTTKCGGIIRYLLPDNISYSGINRIGDARIVAIGITILPPSTHDTQTSLQTLGHRSLLTYLLWTLCCPQEHITDNAGYK